MSICAIEPWKINQGTTLSVLQGTPHENIFALCGRCKGMQAIDCTCFAEDHGGSGLGAWTIRSVCPMAIAKASVYATEECIPGMLW
jgi:hypothetical protein